jgi:hypothetical protein
VVVDYGVCVCIYMCVCVCVYIYICVCVCVYIYMCVYVCVSVAQVQKPQPQHHIGGHEYCPRHPPQHICMVPCTVFTLIGTEVGLIGVYIAGVGLMGIYNI